MSSKRKSTGAGPWSAEETEILADALEESNDTDIIQTVCRDRGLKRTAKQINDKLTQLKRRKINAGTLPDKKKVNFRVKEPNLLEKLVESQYSPSLSTKKSTSIAEKQQENPDISSIQPFCISESPSGPPSNFFLPLVFESPEGFVLIFPKPEMFELSTSILPRERFNIKVSYVFKQLGERSFKDKVFHPDVGFAVSSNQGWKKLQQFGEERTISYILAVPEGTIKVLGYGENTHWKTIGVISDPRGDQELEVLDWNG